MKKKIILGILVITILLLNLSNLYLYAKDEEEANENEPRISFLQVTPEPARIINKEGTFIIYVDNFTELKKENIKITIDNESRAKITNIDMLDETEDGLTCNTIGVTVKFIALGDVDLTVSIDYKGKTYSETEGFVIIESPYSIKLSESDDKELPSTLNVGDKKQLKATFITFGGSIQPEDITSKGATWKSSDDKVIKVDEKGMITAIGKGSASITATYKHGDENVIGKYNVKVIDSNKPTTSPSSTDDPTASPTTTNEPTTSPSASSSPNNKENNEPKQIDSSIAKSILPNTGSNTVLILIGILLVAVISTITYTNSREEKNK